MNSPIHMTGFVRTQIFGTTFEIITRYPGAPWTRDALTAFPTGTDCAPDTLTFNQLEWAHLVLCGMNMARRRYDMQHD